MAKLFAPAGVRSLGIEDDDYTVGEDGTVEVRQRHVAHALSHGFTERKPAPPPVSAHEVHTELLSRLAMSEQRTSALEGTVSTLMSQLSALQAQAGKAPSGGGGEPANKRLAAVEGSLTELQAIVTKAAAAGTEGLSDRLTAIEAALAELRKPSEEAPKEETDKK